MIKVEFEGTDGAGKTTGLKYFVEQAQKKGLTAVETREVGNPHIPICLKLREVVLDPKSNLNGESMEFIFSAMRLENDHWFRTLSENSETPNLVVSDRGWLSHLAYTDHNVNPTFTKLLYQNALEPITLMPDIVIYFSVDTQTALNRRVKRGEEMDAIEIKGVSFQENVRKSFLHYIDLYQHKIKIYTVDANQDIENVKKQLDLILDKITVFPAV